MSNFEKGTYNPAATANSGFTSYGSQSERADANDNTSFGERGNTTSSAGTGSFPSESSGYPNNNMNSGSGAKASGAPDPSFPGTATSTSDARNYGDNPRATVGEPTGAYGSRTSANTDESMFGSSEAGREREQPAQGDSYASGLRSTAERVVGTAMDTIGMGNKPNERS
ncbi:hypothetical protein EXIGLDRAFT_25574 [Exidia glandulosa HHB12029]|uniref:Uncharacterized protein n=1 Tax=Exidia glandulosa HHB12029 TaxID=1314781 RepID=A0A165R350_EXIGL|nr:hypothetical protein EXIGLDRAFT_25574 [Exidia glandulosa HHB12029]